MSKKFKLVFLGIFALALLGCVKKIWQVDYDFAENNYTNHSLQYVTDDSVYLVGRTSISETAGPYSVFVSRFDLNGNFVWETIVPDAVSDFGRFASGSVLAEDADNNVYLAWSNLNSGLNTLHKINAQGIVENSQRLGEGVYVDDIKLADNGSLYYTVYGGFYFYAYTTDGEFLWSDMPTDAEGSSQSTVTLIENNRILVSTNHGLVVYSDAGERLASLNKETVPVDRFSLAQVMNGRIWVSVVASGQARLLALDLSLDVLDEVELGAVAGDVRLATDNGRICLVTGADYTGELAQGSDAIVIHQITESGTLLSQTAVGAGNYPQWYSAKTIGAGKDGCYFGENYGDSTAEDVKSSISLVKADGTITDTVVFDDAILVDFDVLGSDVIRSDTVGEYDGSYTGISIARHNRY